MKTALFLKFVCTAAVLLFVGTVRADNWPQWRGPTGDGISTEKNLPMHWSTTENVKWKVPLPGPGNSTPIIWGNKVFLTQAVKDWPERLLMCFNRVDGKLLWKSGVEFSGKEDTHRTNPYCSASPVTDGERIIVSHASAGVFCYDLNGKKLWHRDLGTQAHIWGNGASPMIHGEICYLNFGPGERSFLIAMDKHTGKTLWQVDDPGGNAGKPVPGKSNRTIWTGSWSTPIVRTIHGREELIMSWPRRALAFNPNDGKVLWECRGLNPLIYTSPIFDDGIVVAMGGYGGAALAVKAGGSGDVTETHRLWHKPRVPQRIGSAVIHEGHYYILNDRGNAQCNELRTGKLVWDERLRGPGKTSQNWSSLVLSEGKLFAVNQAGDAFVFRASPEFELLATNSLDERTIGSMGVSNGEIFIRTYENLWCIAKQ